MIAVVLPRVRAATRFADFGEIEIVQQRHSTDIHLYLS
jgi:hypothetical protein